MRRWSERDEGHRLTTARHELLHWLYNPAELGRKERHRVRFPLLHHIHLIPGRWMDRACDRFDAALEPPVPSPIHPGIQAMDGAGVDNPGPRVASPRKLDGRPVRRTPIRGSGCTPAGLLTSDPDEEQR